MVEQAAVNREVAGSAMSSGHRYSDRPKRSVESSPSPGAEYILI